MLNHNSQLFAVPCTCSRFCFSSLCIDSVLAYYSALILLINQLQWLTTHEECTLKFGRCGTWKQLLAVKDSRSKAVLVEQKNNNLSGTCYLVWNV